MIKVIKYIKYRKGDWKYLLDLSEDNLKGYGCKVKIYPKENIITPFIELYKGGTLFIKNGYAWDGASGPAIDTKGIMIAALVHDALYQLMRMGLLDQDWREQADSEMRRIYNETIDAIRSQSGWFKRTFFGFVKPMRSRWIYYGVRWGGGPSADPKNRKKLFRCP